MAGSLASSGLGTATFARLTPFSRGIVHGLSLAGFPEEEIQEVMRKPDGGSFSITARGAGSCQRAGEALSRQITVLLKNTNVEVKETADKQWLGR